MILMANDYVGSRITEYLCNLHEKIDVFVYTESGNNNYNDEMIEKIKENNKDTMILSYEEFSDSLSEIQKMRIQIGFLAWWPHILCSDMISVTQRGFVNTHPALLPYNRGKHPYFWCMYDNTPFGVSLHFINEKIDEGMVIAQKEILYNWEDTGESLYLRARDAMIDLFKEYYDRIKNGDTVEKSVDWKSGTIHYGKDLDPVCRINLDKEYTAGQLINIIRGRMFNGEGEAYFEYNGEKYYVSISVKKQ